METATYSSQVSTALRLETYLHLKNFSAYENTGVRLFWLDRGATFHFIRAGAEFVIHRKLPRGWVLLIEDEALNTFFRHYPVYLNSPLFDPHQTQIPVKAARATIQQLDELAKLFSGQIECDSSAHLNQPFIDLFLSLATESYRLTNPIPIDDYLAVLLRKFKGLVQDHFKDRSYKTSQYGAALNFTAGDLNKLCRIRVGKNVKDYVDAARISFAKDMLSTSCSYIKEIAFDLGYENQGHFSTYFKRHAGITPEGLRKLENRPRVSNN